MTWKIDLPFISWVGLKLFTNGSPCPSFKERKAFNCFLDILIGVPKTIHVTISLHPGVVSDP